MNSQTKYLYLLTYKQEGPCGHGEPGLVRTCLGSKDSGWEEGEFFPAFKSKEAAEEYKTLYCDNNLGLSVTKIIGIDE